MAPRVIVLGGGVAGMSAAHELTERGFEVDVYERGEGPGGKARSSSVPGTARGSTPAGPRKDLPGEHGFRFFPPFYRHIIDTMKRIPFGTDGRRVADNLMEASRHMMAIPGTKPFIIPVRFPRSCDDLRLMLEATARFDELGLSQSDLEWFGERLWQLMTMSEERIAGEYERVSWWDYLDADRRSQTFRDLLVSGLTRTLVAADPRTASTQVGGRILIELIFAIAVPGRSADHLLNAPTNDAWLDPWLEYLTRRGVRFHFQTDVRRIHCDNARIVGVTVGQGTRNLSVTGDFYVAAVPVEVMDELLTAEMITADETLLGIRELATQVGWMSGVQYFLQKPTPLAHGHVTYVASPWALTSISQGQFWTGTDLGNYGDGSIQDILSVDVSDWFTPGRTATRDRAAACTNRHVIIDEVWEQIRQSLHASGEPLVPDRCPPIRSLDPNVVVGPSGAHNHTPLLVNFADSWHLRPEAYTRIPNLLLASDYVRTNTSLATMEAANEAARRAVNGIVDRCPEMRARSCKIWPLSAPWPLWPLRRHDARRYAKGLPYRAQQPLWLRLFRWVLVALLRGGAKSARWVAHRPAVKRHLQRRR